MKRKFRKLLCKLGIHFKSDWSYDHWSAKYKCSYCFKEKKV